MSSNPPQSPERKRPLLALAVSSAAILVTLISLADIWQVPSGTRFRPMHMGGVAILALAAPIIVFALLVNVFQYRLPQRRLDAAIWAIACLSSFAPFALIRFGFRWICEMHNLTIFP
jgi:hypothetical protein